MRKPMEFRCVQLDLHRQKETVEFVCEFVDFAAQCQYNFLMLSLGDRVRTASYRLRKESESYSPDEIRRIVAHGAGRGVEVFPCVPTLGHAEDFLAHPEMEELAELRHGVRGRWGDTAKIDFCASSPKVREFLARYLAEVAELFPSKYFHAGLDEAWNIGYCELCAPKARTFEGEAGLCLDSLLSTRSILRGLGKRMMIWDDMFEYYPGILEKTPRDVIMVNWQYQRDVRRYEAHFVDLAVEDRLARYDKLGFEYVISPADYNIGNARSFSRHAENYSPLGGLLTIWGKKIFFNHKSFPAVAYAGGLFAGKSEAEAWRSMADSLFGEAIPPGGAEEAALRNVLENTWIHGDMIVNDTSIRCVPFFGRDPTVASEIDLTRRVLGKCSVGSEPGKTVIADMLASLDGALLRDRIHGRVHDAFEHGSDLEGLSPLMDEIDAQKALRRGFWNRLRPGIMPCETDVFYDSVKELCLGMADKIRQGAWVRVRFALPVQYGAPRARVSLRVGGEWMLVGKGVFKMTRVAEDDWDKCLFEQVFPVEPCEPDALMLEVDAYGGTGVCFAEYRNGGDSYTPSAVEEVRGNVASPGHILDNDAKISFFGGGDIHADFSDRAAASVRHTVVVALRWRRQE